MGKHYVISDIHGMYNIYEKVCQILQPDDIVIFLGDAGDRGYDNFRCIKEIYNNPQWVYIKGNHEDLMARGLADKDADGWLCGNGDFELWMMNSGWDTFQDWVKDGADESWIDKLNQLPVVADYTNKDGITFHLSHAGFTLGKTEEIPKNHDYFIWDRHHFLDDWDEDRFSNDVCVHGHTPIEYFVEDMRLAEPEIGYWHKDKPEVKKYANGHKWNIDNGVFYTGKTVLVDLDSGEVIEITDDNFEDPEDD